jgi:hypothetical protein
MNVATKERACSLTARWSVAIAVLLKVRLKVPERAGEGAVDGAVKASASFEAAYPRTSGKADRAEPVTMGKAGKGRCKYGSTPHRAHAQQISRSRR